MKTGVIIQARLGSSRLPGKILMDIEGKSMLQRVAERADRIEGIDTLIIAMPDEAASYQASIQYPRFCGDETNVLKRYYDCAKLYDLDTIVRITADCPALDPAIGTLVLDTFKSGNWDYVSNVRPYSTWPDGTDVEVFNFWALLSAHKNATSAYDREHVTSYLYTLPRPVKCQVVWADKDYSGYKWSVDTQEELDHIRAAYKALGEDFGMKKLLQWEASL